MWIALLKKEINLLGRAKNGLLSILSLSLSMLFLFYFGLEGRGSLDTTHISGLKWAILFLLSYILIGQSVWEERESEAFRINHAHLPRFSPYLIKSLFLYFLLLGVMFFLNLLLALFFEKYGLERKFWEHGTFYLSPALLSLSFLGVTLSYLSQSTRLKEMLLPVLQTPMTVPVFLFGLDAERNAFLQDSFQSKSFWILCLFAILYGALGALVMEMELDE
jgi:heme exporter protein B